MNTGKGPDRRRQEREVYSTEAELYLESSIYKTKLVDFSDDGVRFDMEKPIKVHLRFKIGEKRVDRYAHFIWSRKKEDGIMNYGFKYIDEKKS